MHRRLETYLADVSERLSLIPVNERAEELREMQVHLEQIVAQHQEHGLSEDDAVTITLARFGEPQAVSQDLVTAWQRGESLKNKRSLWSVAACVLALTIIGGLTVRLLPLPIVGLHDGKLTLDPMQLQWLFVSLFMINTAVRVLCGGISGYLFPRCAAAGTALGMLCSITYRMIIWEWALAHFPSSLNTPPEITMKASVEVSSLLFFAGTTVFSAWVGSRWRMRRELALAR